MAFAASSSVEGLWLNAGITNIDGGAIAANVAPIQGLFNLIDNTFSSSTRVFAQASTAEFNPMFPGDLIAPILMIDSGTGNARIQGGGASPNHVDSTVSNWLVRDVTTASVPEPSTFLLLGSGLVGLAGWQFRKKQLK